jgi:hypothetical protein
MSLSCLYVHSGYIGGTMYLAIILCVNNSIPSHLAGTINGVAQAFAALGNNIITHDTHCPYSNHARQF